MTTSKTRKAGHPTQGAVPTKPPIDRTAEEAEVTSPAPAAPVADDAPMPTVEQQPPYFLAPTAQMGIKDVMECQLMVLSELFGVQVPPQKGIFRERFISAEKFDLLSDSAQRFFKQANPPAPAADDATEGANT